VLSPPHLVYKWRREIQETVAGAKVWVLNGPDTLVKLIKLREQLGVRRAARSSSSSGACGCGWVPLEARLQRAAHAPRRRGRCPDCGRSSPTSTASRSTRSNSKPRTTAAGAAIAPHRCGR
jgi:hypothetical protein